MNFKVLKILCILLTVNCLWVQAHLIFRQSVTDSDAVGGGEPTGLLGAITKISKDLRAGVHKMRDSVVSGIHHTIHKLGNEETKVEPVLQESSTEPEQCTPMDIDVRITFFDDVQDNADRNDEPGMIAVTTPTTQASEATTVEITLDNRALFDAPSPCPPNHRMAKDGHCRKVQS